MSLTVALDDLRDFRNYLTGEIRKHYGGPISAATHLPDPLMMMVAAYVAIDTKIVSILYDFVQRAATDPSHKLAWRVKHRPDPLGSDLAEIFLEYNRTPPSSNNHRKIPCITIGMSMLDKRYSGISDLYKFQLDRVDLCYTSIESDGETIRLNIFKKYALPDTVDTCVSNDTINDIYAIALAKLHQMIRE